MTTNSNRHFRYAKNSLYIKGLPQTTTDETLRALITKEVTPRSCKALVENGRCKGDGIIDFETEEDASKVMDDLKSKSSREGLNLEVRHALHKSLDYHNVYVQNLPKTNFNEDDLRTLFASYGHIISTKLFKNKDINLGFGFVRFAEAQQAQNAIECINQEKIILIKENDGEDADKSRQLSVFCKLAYKQDTRRQKSHGNGRSLLGNCPLCYVRRNGTVWQSNPFNLLHSIPFITCLIYNIAPTNSQFVFGQGSFLPSSQSTNFNAWISIPQILSPWTQFFPYQHVQPYWNMLIQLPPQLDQSNMVLTTPIVESPEEQEQYVLNQLENGEEVETPISENAEETVSVHSASS